jgi:hypothetical protein
MDRTVCHNEVCTSGWKCSKAGDPLLLMQAGKDGRPSTSTNEQNMGCAQAVILGNCSISAVRLDISVAHPWSKPLV